MAKDAPTERIVVGDFSSGEGELPPGSAVAYYGDITLFRDSSKSPSD